LLGVMKDSDRRYARERSWDFDVVEQGWRYHMSDIMASIGRVQLKRFINEFQQKRRALFQHYRQALANTPDIELLTINPDNDVVPHIMAIRVLNGKRDALRTHCLANGMQIGMHYKPNHLLTKFAKPNVTLPVAEKLYDELMTLPMHVDLTPENIEFIVSEINSFMGK